ncbi:MAG: hypothetical protein WC733_05685, partial [Methylophilus sp.]
SLSKHQQEKQKLDERAAQADLYELQNKAELQALLIKQAELASHIELAELRWLELHELLENIS